MSGEPYLNDTLSPSMMPKDDGRITTIKVYNRTYRYVYYEGYEEVDGYLRAQIDSSSKTVEFDKGQSYYYDYPLQVQDAYQSYKIMG